MILLHGNGEDHSIFAETAEILKEHFAVYMPDTRGHGRSEGVEEYHYADMAEDLRELIRALGLERPLLCGFSDGGIVGLLAAVRDPGLLSAMVLCGANLTPKGMKTRWYRLFQKEYQRTGDAKLKLMLREPHITAEQLARIRIPVLVTAGSRDLIRRRETGGGSRKLYRPLRETGGASGRFFRLTRTGRFGKKLMGFRKKILLFSKKCSDSAKKFLGGGREFFVQILQKYTQMRVLLKITIRGIMWMYP